MRRKLIVAAALLAVAIAMPVRAQDARATAAQAAAREWLALADNGEGLASYEAAGSKFRSTIPGEQWVSALADSRKRFGAVVQRAVVSTKLTRTLPGVPEGDYASLVFRAAYANQDVVQELVTMEFAEGKWRVIGFIIK